MKIRKVKALILILFIIGSISLINFSAYLSDNKVINQNDEKNDQASISNLHTSANSNFSYYKIITINHTKVCGSEDLIDFPVLISIVDSDLHEHAQEDGDDIAFSDGVNWLDHEIELFNQSYTSTEARLVAWVCIPSLSPSTDTEIFMYYGNSTMDSQENPSGVWSNIYKGVWHLNEKSGNAKDSTSYGTSGTPTGDVNQGIEGQIDGSYEFDGDDDEVSFGNPADGHLDFATNSFTVSFWVNFFGSTDDYQLPLYKGGNMDSISGYEFETNQAGSDFDFQISDGSNNFHSSQISITHNSWFFVVGVVDRSLNLQRIYKNGTEMGSATDISSLGSVDTDLALRFSWDWYSINGTIDEVRIIGSALSADWIATEYSNQIAPDNFYSVGIKHELLKHPDNAEYFTYYKEITIYHTKVNGSENLINFPILINILDSDLYDSSQPDGDDIAFGFNNIWLDHEIEYFNQTYSDTQAKLVVWVRIPSLSPSIDTKIKMYYGNSTMNSRQNPTGVWDDNFVGVWHLSEDPIGTVYDSTSNNNDGTTYGSMNSEDQISGKIDGSLEFDGDNDYIDCGNDNSLDITGDIMIEFWVKAYDVSNDPDALTKGSYTQSYSTFLYRDNTVYFRLNGISDRSLQSSKKISLGDWYSIVCTRTGNTMKIFMNGSEDVSDTFSGTIETVTEPLTLAGSYDNLNGVMDEIRLSNVARSSDWITTQYNNQYDPDSFYTVGDEQFLFDHPLDDNNFKYFKVITIDHTKVFGLGCHINFPLLISILDEDLQDYVQSDNGHDIAFTQGNKWLDHEIELFNRTYDISNAQLIVWVRVPFLSTSVDTNITMYFGNVTTMNPRQNPAGVWDTNYKGVWHLKENPDISLPQDSTSNGNDAIEDNLNSSNQVDGKIDGCFSFEGSDDDNEMHFNVSDSSSLQLDGDITISAWVKTDEVDYEIEALLTKWGPGATSDNKNYWLGKIYDEFRFYVDSVSQYVQVDMNLINDSQWHHIVAVADSVNNLLILYVDGVQQNTAAYSGTLSPGTYILSIGMSSGCQDQEWNGLIDDIRISNTSRSADWIATKYNNTQDPNNFYSLGSAQKVDITPPSWSNLIESEEILELGDTEIISIDVFDLSGIKQVLIEINELTNYTMEYMSGNTWRNNSWTPTFTGKHNYTIYIEDNHNNWNSTSGDIFVEDKSPPSWSNLVESEEILELGDTEIISIDVFDLSEINQVLIEINELTNYTMEYVSGNTWHNNSWTPTFTGKHNYTIYIEDIHNNWNSTSDSIQVVDTTGPSWSNLIKIDPLEKGSAETITIDIVDLSDISAVIFEIQGINYTMVNIGGDTWQNDTWTPSSTGIYPFTIYMNDTHGNWNMTSGDISVISSTDTTPPTWSNLIESANPLELGSSETISIDIFDDRGILEVKFEIDGTNYTMYNISLNTWRNNTWIPSFTGDYDYTIYIRDIGNNWNTTAVGTIQVQDTIKPQYSNLEESADPLTLGNIENITITITDISGINQVLIEIGGVNHTMRNIDGTNIWCNDSWIPTTTGYHDYTIYMEDNNNNWNSVSGQIFVISDTTTPSDGGGGGGGGGSSSSSSESDILPIILVIIGGAVGALVGIIIFIKKRSSPPRDKELETIESIID